MSDQVNRRDVLKSGVAAGAAMAFTAASYDVGVAVLTGSPGSLSAVTCFAFFGTFSATAGQLYHIGVGDIGGGSGGFLRLLVQTPGVELSVDRFGRFDNKTGVATVAGTLTCASGSTASTVTGTLSQRTTTAGTMQNVSCNGAAQPWSIAFTPLDGKFKGGPADVSVDASVLFPLGGLADHVDRSLILRG